MEQQSETAPLYGVMLHGSSRRLTHAGERAGGRDRGGCGTAELPAYALGRRGDSVVTTVWDDRATAMHAELAGMVDRTGEFARSMSGVPADTVRSMLDYLTQSQSVMLATNSILWSMAIVFACAAAIIWIAPRPTRAVDLRNAGH